MFCHGPYLESVLNEYLPKLRQFDYTMTYRLVDKILIEDFNRWSMHAVFNENKDYKWVHIYSLPWPSNKGDKRQLPIVQDEYNTLVQSDTRFRRARNITTDILIDLALPERIREITFTKRIFTSTTNIIVQPFVRHLVVQYCLIDAEEISNFAHR
ncbi:unnamed protein product, partial [Rotaria sp. Silwood1]